MMFGRWFVCICKHMQDCNNSKVFCKTESVPKSNQFSYVMEKVISNKHAAALYSTLELGTIS